MRYRASAHILFIVLEMFKEEHHRREDRCASTGIERREGMTRKNLIKRINTIMVKNRAHKTVPLRLPKPSMAHIRKQAQDMASET